LTGFEVALKTPMVFVSIVFTIHVARSRTSMNWTGSSGLSGARIWPVREAVRAVVRAHDEAGAHVRGAAGHRGFGGLFAQRLEAAVRLLGHLFDSRVLQDRDRPCLVDARLAQVGEDGDGRHENVLLRRFPKQGGRVAHLPREVA